MEKERDSRLEEAETKAKKGKGEAQGASKRLHIAQVEIRNLKKRVQEAEEFAATEGERVSSEAKRNSIERRRIAQARYIYVYIYLCIYIYMYM